MADAVVRSAIRASWLPRHIYLLNCKWQSSVCRELSGRLLPLQTSSVEEEVHFMMVSTAPLESKRTITRVGTLIVATIYLQLIQNRYIFRSFTVFHCSYQHCVQPVASVVEVVGYL